MRRPAPGDVLAGLAGALLLVSLFLPWYRLRSGADLSGWQAFAVIDLLLALAGVLGVGAAVVAATRRTTALPVGLAVLAVLAGALATLLVVFRLVDPPGSGGARDIAAGAWLALAAAAGVTAGGWMAAADERNRGVPAPAVEVRAAPPTGSASS